MKTGVCSITYAVAEPRTYLVVGLEPGIEPVEFCVRMAERNRIPGLLPMHQQIDDGETALYFDISGKRRLQDVLREAEEKQLLMLLSSLTRALQGLPDYFLRSGQCLLEPECAFADGQGTVWLPLVPLDSDPQDSSPALRSYLTTLLGAYGGTPTPKVAALIAAVIKPDFTLESFAALLTPSAPSAPEPRRIPEPQPVFREPVRPAAPPAVPEAEPPAPAAEKKPELFGKKFDLPVRKKEEPREQPAPAGFAIPGMAGVQIPGAVPVPDEKKKKKEKPEKKEKKTFGLLGRKKEGKVDMDKEAHMVSAAIPMPTPARPEPTPAYAAAPVRSTPAPEPSYGSQWSGTVQLAEQGATEFIDSAAGLGAALLHGGRRVELTAQTFTVGRVNCSYVVDNPKVSRPHATILRDGRRYLIRDENSSNHTYVNGVMIPPYTPVELEDGCEIRMGSEEFRFQQGSN